ncbi:hypothetical protein K0A97_02585 [Patescibacteria group bacterium]|nr:hypothetical protein [Patescibacteria group bacterium]
MDLNKKIKLKNFPLNLIVLIASLIVILLTTSFVVAEQTGPDSINITGNETKLALPGVEVNISGGYISSLNITASIQNPRWKAFVGWVFGLFTLDNSNGSTIYDWQLATISGNVYATRNDTLVQWDQIKCANSDILESENIILNHSNPNDNLTATFSGNTHDDFYVGTTHILSDSCPSLYTYINDTSQNESFQEVVLFDGVDYLSPGNLIYTTILEDSIEGYDGNKYDFQMIVPERGNSDWEGATAYYLYIELV